MIPSKYQSNYFACLENEKCNIFLDAKAGSGKTTTIVQSLEKISGTILFLAFNKSIATELQGCVPRYVQVSTFNAYGWGVLKRPGTKIDGNKVKNIILYDFFSGDWSKAVRYYNSISRLISLVKAHNETVSPSDLIDQFGIEVPDDWEEVYNEVYTKALRESKVFDFDDQLFMPLKWGLPFPQFDYIFVDEAQDLNLTQIEILRKSLRGRLICVGDPHQAIYGFRGADNEAVEKIKKQFNMKVLPLSISYRCSKNIIREAQKFVPDIEYNETAEEGEIRNICLKEFSPSLGDYVLCRTTAPLVQQCLNLIRSGTRAFVLGRDIEENLKQLNKQVKNCEGNCYYDQIDLKRQELVKKYKGIKLETYLDQLDTLLALFDYDEDVETAINFVFQEQKGSIRFSTIHKAKGLEADNVYILRPDLLPHPAAKLSWEQIQEKNLHYVAVTRAKKILTYVR